MICAAPHEDLARPLVDDQIEIPPPIALLRIRQPVPFFRQRQQRLVQHLDALDPHRQLVRLRPKKVPGNPNDVAQVEKLKKLESLLAHHVEPRIDLQPPAIARQMRERRLPHRPQRDNPARHAHANPLCFKLFDRSPSELLRHLFGRVRPVEFVRVCRMPEGLDFS